MAIDRTKIYYQEWTTAHGWRCRLEIIPAGDVASKPTTFILVPSSIISVESDEWSFEDLPFGAWKAPTMRATVDLRHCPANLVEMLQNQVYESTVSPWTYTVTNLFILYSDRGNAALDYEDYHVEFCGGQNLQQGNKRTINNKNLKPERMTVEVWDLGMLLLQEHPVKEWAEYCYTYATPVMERSLIENYVTDSWQHISLLNVPYPTTSGTLRARLYLYPLAELFGEHLAESLRVHLSMWTRGLILFQFQSGAIESRRKNTYFLRKIMTYADNFTRNIVGLQLRQKAATSTTLIISSSYNVFATILNVPF